MTTTALTKQVVANRLIHAAVDMFDTDADPLAIHVVACSAFNLLRELSKVGGALFVERVFRSVLFDAATKRLNGEGTGLPDHPVVTEWIEGIAAAIDAGQMTTADEIKVTNSQKAEFDTLRFLIGPFNFLKHADTDPDGVIAEQDLKPVEATSFALTAYGFLFPDDELDSKVAKFLQQHAII